MASFTGSHPTTSDPSNLVRWLYLDMNSFFASVEQEMNPDLRGKPVAVVPLLADTTCCIAVSYEGKAYGVKTGTKVGEAKKLCPKIKFVVGDHQHYIRYHHQIIEAVESCVPVETVCSIDEIACRLTGSQQDINVARALALRIKRAIQERVGLFLLCSIGIAPNRYLAKIAADMEKPDGLTLIRPRDLPNILYSLKLRDLPGVGPQMEARLRQKKIYTMEALYSSSAKELRQAWGSVNGEQMWHLLRGLDIEEKKSPQKSISHSHVLPPELRNASGGLQVLKKLTAKAVLRTRKEGFWVSQIEIWVRFLRQDSWSAKARLMETQDTLAFLHAVIRMWEDLPSGPLYAVGVALSGLVPDSMRSPSLFDDPKRESLTKALDRINEKFGFDTIHYGATHETESLAPLRIAFTRIPDVDSG